VLWNTPTFSGWALDDLSSIRRIDILIDGKVIGSAVTNQSRPDVCAAYPNRQGCPYVGWQFTPNIRFLTNGVHTLTAIATSAINSEATASTTFNVQNADGTSATRMYIDVPASSGSALSGNITFVGWALNQNTSLSRVAIAVDNIPVSTVNQTQFVPRPDVCTVYPDAPACPNVGWSVPFDTTSLANGVHVLKVTATSQVQFDQPATVFKMFTISNAADSTPIKSYIDIPAANATVSGVTSFSGWAVHNTNPIASVVIYIDGVAYGPAYYGVSRGDVCAAFPNEDGCPAGNVGWAFAFDTTLIRNGTHALQVESSSADGAHYTISQQFKVSN
jgi:N-acetylmuramoyl-L-alanine amidase